MHFYILLLVFFSFHISASERSSLCPGESGYFYVNDRNSSNPKQGGFVSFTADVNDDTIWLGRSAAICGYASVSNHARIAGNALVCGNAIVSGRNILITGNAKVCGDAIVQPDPRSQDRVIMRGFFEAEDILYESGIYDKKVAPTIPTTPTPVNKKAEVDKFIRELKSFTSSVILHDYEDYDPINNRFITIPKLEYIQSFHAQSDNINDPCEIKFHYESKFRNLSNYWMPTRGFVGEIRMLVSNFGIGEVLPHEDGGFYLKFEQMVERNGTHIPANEWYFMEKNYYKMRKLVNNNSVNYTRKSYYNHPPIKVRSLNKAPLQLLELNLKQYKKACMGSNHPRRGNVNL